MIRRLARPMLASVFVIDGIETLRNPQTHVADAAPLVDQATPLVEKGEQAVNERVNTTVPPVPKDTETLVKALAGVKIGAGALFALGKAPRLSALALTASHVPSTVSRHAFWTESDPAARSRKTTGLATDVALLGALLIASADTAGQPGLAWRAGKARDKVAARLPGAKAEALTAGSAVAGVAHTVADQARDAADTVRDKAPEVAEQVRERAPEVAEQVRDQASGIAGLVKSKAPVIAAQVRDRVADAREQVAPYAAEARERATTAAHLAAEEAGPLAAQARDRAGSVAANVADRVEEIDTSAVRKTAKDARKAAEKRGGKTEKRARKAGADARKKSDKLRKKAARAIAP
ncbi:DoxX family membrane protein [Dietzia aurantiaca]|uniref:DoxX family protein n=1 Tax=Dietzia aurantiaca TaxID=983873 RepID=UPI001E5122A4|nr:DoxX family protein [Dietzia aurantiaca]MCD2264243.1 DoxX family membrane protein [Dietzia aurantiaca]